MSKKQEATTSINPFIYITRRIYDYIQVLSLDVVIGSIFTSCFFARITNSSIPFYYYIFLGISVWLVYTIDHLIDAYKIDGVATTFRHRFHQNHFKILCTIWGFIFTVSTMLTFLYLPQHVIISGLYVAGIVAAHLILVVFLWTKVSKLIQKEIGVGIGYTLGVLLLPYLYGELNFYFYLSSLELFILVMLNIYLFSFFDEEKDKLHGQTSITRNVGNSGVLLLLNFLFTITTILILITSFIYTEQLHYQLIFILMLAALFSLYLFESYFAKNDRYRLLGDGVFLFPLMLIAYEWL